MSANLTLRRVLSVELCNICPTLTITSLNIVWKARPGVRLPPLRLTNIPLCGYTALHASAHPLWDVWVAYTLSLL